MRVVLVDPPPEFLQERERLGIDRRDEVWDGVLHVPPQPTMTHQRLAARLIETLGPLARARQLEVVPEPNLLDPTRGFKQFRVPDLVVVAPAATSERGVEGAAELVVELLSPNDESRDKFSFYASRGVKEIWLIEPTTRIVELYLLRGATYFTTLPDRDGILRSGLFDLELRVVEGPKLRLAWQGGSVEV
ncbi:MAG: Uma2 family endonuclease [Deltaproteobacteria bacterium]|nr:Uma2 family endonuclease [Deltaproteobacteria bacterium]MDQ3301318.1 Uma2 family endonuclease [Myxococcota bacterium]